jgi:Zn-dependent protease with chaperone function
MTLLGQFLLYNLLPSLVIGFVAWLVLMTAFALLPIRKASLRLSLLFIPLVKSALLLLGLGLILPWPKSLVITWHAQAVPPHQVLPYVLIWAGLAFIISIFVVQRARQHVLHTAQPAPPRLVNALEDVLLTYRQTAAQTCTNGSQCNPAQVPEPRLLISDDINSPVALTAGGEPMIIFPTGLLSDLTDVELNGAIAHELTHFALRWPSWCSVSLLRKFAIISPAAGLVIMNVSREEEKACDEMAVRVMGDSDAYAEMLLKSYRYALNHARPIGGKLQVLPRLLGFKPMLTDRVEQLLHPPSRVRPGVQLFLTCLLWTILSSIFFVF